VEAEAQRRGYRPVTFARRLKMGKIDAVGWCFRSILSRPLTAYLWTWLAKLAALNLVQHEIDLLLIADDDLYRYSLCAWQAVVSMR
jgi:LacI family transcriptional regulator